MSTDIQSDKKRFNTDKDGKRACIIMSDSDGAVTAKSRDEIRHNAWDVVRSLLNKERRKEISGIVEMNYPWSPYHEKPPTLVSLRGYDVVAIVDFEHKGTRSEAISDATQKLIEQFDTSKQTLVVIKVNEKGDIFRFWINNREASNGATAWVVSWCDDKEQAIKSLKLEEPGGSYYEVTLDGPENWIVPKLTEEGYVYDTVVDLSKQTVKWRTPGGVVDDVEGTLHITGTICRGRIKVNTAKPTGTLELFRLVSYSTENVGGLNFG